MHFSKTVFLVVFSGLSRKGYAFSDILGRNNLRRSAHLSNVNPKKEKKIRSNCSIPFPPRSRLPSYIGSQAVTVFPTCCPSSSLIRHGPNLIATPHRTRRPSPQYPAQPRLAGPRLCHRPRFVVRIRNLSTIFKIDQVKG
ncbi:hypothetical protein BS50DRAFT_349785 [Corynespora cassiicola Philippines]|uniref:Uncharacterized protein n=1 Tax=Corynespora cassiicola Philippines TaxID=1448308 RepID=A0A2T2NQW9_CORCC|nr:hypothetical protein BS50DRAFT_349785 [Corynespora cassiicola Philippines]